MPWEMIAAGVGLALLVGAGLLQMRRRRSTPGPIPEVGQPPEGAEPIAEPRLQDIGSASYELPLPGQAPDADRDPD